MTNFVPVASILGHEGVGRVEASGRPDLTLGQLVTFCVCDVCGECDRCLTGLTQKCRRLMKVRTCRYSFVCVAEDVGTCLWGACMYRTYEVGQVPFYEGLHSDDKISAIFRLLNNYHRLGLNKCALSLRYGYSPLA